MEHCQQWQLRRNRTVGIRHLCHGHGNVRPRPAAQGNRPLRPPRRTHDRFDTSIQPKDLTIGLDGILSALDGSSSPTSTVYKFDPLTGLSLGTVPIQFEDNRAVAAAADGTIFVATLGGAIRQYSATGGTPLTSLTVQNARFSDIDLTATGGVALGTADGDVVVTTTALGSFTKFRATDSTLGGTTFVAWVVPEPATLPLILSATALLAGLRRRR